MFLNIMVGFMLLSAIITVICLVNAEDFAPVGKTFSSLFVGLVAVILTCVVGSAQEEREHSFAGNAVPVYDSATGAVSRQDLPPPSAQAEQLQERKAIERAQASAPVVATSVPGQAVSAPAQVVAPAASADSGLKDALLGGALGYALGSAGNRSGGFGSGPTHTTTVIHQAAPPAVPPPVPAAPVAARPATAAPFSTAAYRPSTSATASPPAARPAPAATRATFKSTFSMTRTSRR